MSVIITNQSAKNIRNKYDFRLSAPYYYLMEQLKELSKKGERIYSIAEVSPQIDSGSYIDNYVPEGTRYIRVGDLKKYVIDMSESAFIDKNQIKPKMILSKGDICFARTQATFDKLGNFAIIDELNLNEVISQHLSKIHPTKYVSSEYLVAYLNSKFGKRQMCIASYGDTRVELTHNQTKEIKIILLDDETVNQIEEKVKELIDCNQKAHYAFNKAQRIIDDQFYAISLDEDSVTTTKQLLVDNNLWSPTCYKPQFIQTINRIKNGVTYKKLKDLITGQIHKGIEVGSDNYLIELEKDTSDLPFIRTSDIYNNEIDYSPDYYVSKIIAKNNKCPDIRKDDIIFSKDGKIGQVGIINEANSIVPSSGYSIIRNNSTIPTNYLFAILSHKEIVINQAKMKTVIAATIPHLKVDKVANFLIPIFSEEIVLQIDKLIAEFRNNISKKQAIIREIDATLNLHYSRLFNKPIFLNRS